MRAVIADDSVLMREGITRILAEGDIDEGLRAAARCLTRRSFARS